MDETSSNQLGTNSHDEILAAIAIGWKPDRGHKIGSGDKRDLNQTTGKWVVFWDGECIAFGCEHGWSYRHGATCSQGIVGPHANVLTEVIYDSK